MDLQPNDIVTPNRKVGLWINYFGKEYTVLDVKGEHCRLMEIGDDAWFANECLDIVPQKVELPEGVKLSVPGLRPEKRNT